MTDSGNNAYTDTGRYTFHVGPVAELEVQAAWDAPGAFTLTAVNHGPDAAPAAQVTVTPPSGLRFARGETSWGSFDSATGVWDIGKLETSEYLRAVGQDHGPTLTVFTEPTGAVTQTVNPQSQDIAARIENAEDYCVRIKTSDPSPDNDLECRGNPPSGYTDHSAEYYDHRPDNNGVTLPADWSAAPAADIRLTGIAITSEGGYQVGDDIEATASFNKAVTVAGQPRLRLRVGEITREAALHSNSGSRVVFRYRVQEDDSDAVDGISIPPSPFLLPPGAGISAPGGGTVSLLFAGLADQVAHRVYPTVDRVTGTNILVWSPPENLYTGVEGARYRLFERMRHYYRYNDLTRRWEIEFRIADASLDAPDQNLLQWLVLRANGYYLGRPHPYGAAPVEMKPYLGGWAGGSEHRQQLCIGFKAEFSPGKTWEERLEELGNVQIDWISHVGFGEYGISTSWYVESLLGTARDIAAGATCPDPPSGMVNIQGQQSTKGPLGATLSDPNGVDQESVIWQWKRSPDGTNHQDVDYTGFNNIPGANGPTYAPGMEDEGRWLRVKATYTDGQRSTRTAWGQSEGPVTGHVQEGPPAHQPGAGQAGTVSLDAESPLVPAGLGPGDSFRLLFVTSTTTRAESADVADYDGFVQARAAANTNLADFSNQFTALISTSTVDARDNTGTTGDGVSVHWLGGEKVADDYADLYDGDWDSISGTTEDGYAYAGLVWTGGNKQGEKSGQKYAGAAEVRMGDLSHVTLAASSPTSKASSEAYPLYALSPVIAVDDPKVDRLGMVSLDTEMPQAGSSLRAVLLDPDGVITGSVAWQWQRSPEGTTAQGVAAASFEDISGATGETYTPVEEDVGRWLRVRATYTDGHGPVKTALARTASPVAGQVQGAPPDQQQQAAAVITGLKMHSPGPYGTGDAISVAVAFSREVTVAGVPELSIELGGQGRTATYDAARSGPAAPVFSYTVREGDQDGDGVSVYPGSITLPEGASITDSGGSDAELTQAGLAPQPGHTVEAPGPSPPSVTGLEMRSAGPYAAGDAIEVVAHFSEPVAVAGTPSLRLQVGDRTRAAHYTADGSDNDSKVFRYTAHEEDRDEDGVSVAAGSIALPYGASIWNAGGIDAALTHTGLPAQTGHAVGSRQQQAANNEPQFALDGDTRSVAENATQGSNVGNPVTASDADSDALTYALTGSGSFAIDPSTGQIFVLGALDYETQSTYSLTVSVGDGKDASGGADTGVDDTIAITVSVGNVDEAGGVALDPETPQAGSAVTAKLSDPDGVVAGSVAWQWKRSPDGTNAGNVDATNFEDIAGATAATYTPVDADAGRWLRVKAVYTDGHGSGKGARAQSDNPVAAAQQQQQATANNEPQFALDSDARSVAEYAAPGSNVGNPVTAGDADGDRLTYALTGSDSFAIDPSTGQIFVLGALDYETQSTYSLTVSVGDGKDASGGADDGVDDTIAVTVSVGNVDEAGTVTLDPERPQVGSLLTATLKDPDRGLSRET